MLDQLLYLFDIGTNYVSFGLAIYAAGAVCAFWWTRRVAGPVQSPDRASGLRAGTCVVALIALEVMRQFWDTFHYQHFPLWITRLILPVLYVTLGNALFRLSNVAINPEPKAEPVPVVLNAPIPVVQVFSGHP